MQLDPHPSGPSLHCFIVDDEHDIRFLISHTLARCGATFSEFANATAAIECLESESPSVVFLDISLEGSDAVEALRGLAQADYGGIVQVISGHNPSILDNTRKIGERHGLRMRAPIAKPFNAAAIRAVIEEVRLSNAESPAPALQPSVEPHLASTAGRAAAEDRRQRVSLKEAMRHGWVEFWYLPKLDLQKLRLVGAEGLARVRHPELGLIEPPGFLPGAGEVELAVLGGLAIEAALRDWTVFANRGLNLKLAVNMSAASLDILPVTPLIRQHGQPENWPGLILEVAEGDVIHDMARMQEIATQLALCQVSLSMDDFGGGVASLARLRDLPFAEVKLDRGFVRNCATDERNKSICQGAIDLAHRLRAAVVAEGIETAAELKALVQMGCDLGQGFLFSRPLERDQLIAWARAQSQKTSPLVPAE